MKTEIPSSIRTRAEQLIEKWRREQAEYPTTSEGLHSAAAVRCCANELESLLASLVASPSEQAATFEDGWRVAMSSLPAANRCVRHPEAERLDGCIACVAAEISKARAAQEAAEQTLAHLHTLVELDEIEDLGTRLAAAERERDEAIESKEHHRAAAVLNAKVVGETERALASLTEELKAELKRVCMDCSEVFEWSQVDDIGRCGRCYKRLVEGQPRLNPGAGVHPDKRYVPASALASLQQQMSRYVEHKSGCAVLCRIAKEPYMRRCEHGNLGCTVHHASCTCGLADLLARLTAHDPARTGGT